MNPLRAMKLPVILALLTASAFAQDLVAIRKQVEEQIATMPVVAHFDQPYAGAANPKQKLDLYLPRERKSDQPLPVVVFIHGGAWKAGDRRAALIPITEGGHGFHNPQVFDRVTKFFDRHLRGVSVEISDAPLPDVKPAR